MSLYIFKDVLFNSGSYFGKKKKKEDFSITEVDGEITQMNWSLDSYYFIICLCQGEKQLAHFIQCDSAMESYS